MKDKPLFIITTFVALLPLFFGSAIFWIWFLYPQHELQTWGVYTILTSIPLCLLGLILLVYLRFKNKNNSVAIKKIVRNTLLILLNIPISICYLLFAIYLTDVERITIVNNTENDITDAYVWGVGDNHLLGTIEKGCSKTIWVYLEKEGGIKMTYREDGKLNLKSIVGYTGAGMGGHRFDYHLRLTQEDINRFY